MASDDFNRANANPLNGSWTKPTPFSAMKIVSNAVLGAGGADSGAFSSVSTVSSSQVTLAAAGGRDGGPGIHMDASGNGYVLNNNDAGNFYIFRMDAGSFVDLGNHVVGTYANGDVLRIRRSGSSIIASVNGVDKVTIPTDNTYTGGRPGMHAFDGTISFDDWTDGVAAPAYGAVPIAGPGISPDRRKQFTAPRRAIISLAPITGSSATTNANDTSQATGIGFVSFAALKRPGPGVSPFNNGQFIPAPRSAGVSLAAVTGSSATTNANDTSAASGTTTVTGSSARTNANDASAASGTTTVLGTSARTNSNDASAASGTTTVLGASATTNSNDTSTASGSVGGAVSGTSATTNANDSAIAAGTTTVVGTSARTNADDSIAASGWVGAITGTAATTNANDAASASGQVGDATFDTGAGPQKRRRRRAYYGPEDEPRTVVVQPAQTAPAVVAPAEPEPAAEPKPPTLTKALPIKRKDAPPAEDLSAAIAAAQQAGQEAEAAIEAARLARITRNNQLAMRAAELLLLDS